LSSGGPLARIHPLERGDGVFCGISINPPVGCYTYALPLALIWLARIGMDRAVGYGLKYASGFKDTHLGRV
jgi:hypothetical protein